VLVVSEIFGVHEYIADVVRRFAKAGCFAVAPELFIRQGDATSYGEIAKLLAEVTNQVPDAQVMADLDATVAWAGLQGAGVDRTAITGFCWGGRITWLYAAHNPTVKAGVAWYGRLVGGRSALTPAHPVDLAGRLVAPVLGLYGGQDSGIPLDTIDKMKGALAAGSAPAPTRHGRPARAAAPVLHRGEERLRPSAQSCPGVPELLVTSEMALNPARLSSPITAITSP